jgi:hypothetical protein
MNIVDIFTRGGVNHAFEHAHNMRISGVLTNNYK